MGDALPERLWDEDPDDVGDMSPDELGDKEDAVLALASGDDDREVDVVGEGERESELIGLVLLIGDTVAEPEEERVEVGAGDTVELLLDDDELEVLRLGLELAELERDA